MDEGSNSLSLEKSKTEDPDPVTGLSLWDKYMLRDTWDKIIEDAKGNGVAFFMRLFEIDPKYLQAFPFRDVPLKELPMDKKFHAHVTITMYGLGSIVKNVDDTELMNGVINKITQKHVTRMVDRQALIDVKQALLDIYSFMTKEQISAWTKFLDYFVEEGTKTIIELSNEQK